MQFFLNGKDALCRSKRMTKGSFGVALGGDDLADAEVMRKLDGLNDLMCLVPIRAGWVEQIGVGTDTGQGNAMNFSHLSNHSGMGLQAGRSSKSIFGSQRSAIM